MINFLSKWIEGIAVTIIIASIFEMILPNGNIKKYLKIVLGIYIIFSMISPFVDSKALYSIDLSKEMEKYTQSVPKNTNNYQNNDLNEIYANTLEKEIKQTIEKKGYNVYKCTVEGVFDADKKDTGIKKINVVLESKKNAVEKKVENKIRIDDIDKVDININKKKEDESKITQKDINELKQYICDHYEIEQKVLNIEKR